MRSLSQALRLAGLPILGLAALCIGLGIRALSFDPGAAMALFVAGTGTLIVFVLSALVVCHDEVRPVSVMRNPVDRRHRHR